MRGHIAAGPWGPSILKEIRTLSERLSMAIPRKGAESISPEERWAEAARHLPRAEVIPLPGVEHGLPPRRQAAVADRFGARSGRVVRIPGP